MTAEKLMMQVLIQNHPGETQIIPQASIRIDILNAKEKIELFSDGSGILLCTMEKWV